MKYSEFNNWVFKYYSENLIPNQINSLTIPTSEYEELKNSLGLVMSAFPEVYKNHWSDLLGSYSNGIPKYLGLLALQCHAAFMMHNDGAVTAANFRERFIDLVGIESDSKLNSFFGEAYNSHLNIQEKIWYAASNFFSNQNIIIDLPEKKSYAGRNTQYPQSQSILNYEDLKEYSAFYRYVAESFDVIHYDEFCREYFIRLPSLKYYFKRSNNLKDISDSENKIKLKQIFDHYNSSEWLNVNCQKLTPRLPIILSYYLKVEDNAFIIYDENYEEIPDIIPLINTKKILFFKKDLDYHQEYNFCPKLEGGSEFIIVLQKTTFTEQLQKKLSAFPNALPLNNSNTSINAYAIDLNDGVPEFLIQYIGPEYPVKLIGPKVSRKRQYLKSSPPYITCKDNVSFALYLNNKRLPYDQPFHVGNYSIKVNGFSTYSFEIIDDPVLLRTIDISLPLLNFATMEFCTTGEGHLSGLFFEVDNERAKDDLSIKRWIKINTTGIDKSNKILLRALNNNKYG